MEVVAILRSGGIGLVDGREDCCDGGSKPVNLNNRAALAFINFNCANAAQAYDDEGERNRNAAYSATLSLTQTLTQNVLTVGE